MFTASSDILMLLMREYSYFLTLSKYNPEGVQKFNIKEDKSVWSSICEIIIIIIIIIRSHMVY